MNTGSATAYSFKNMERGAIFSGVEIGYRYLQYCRERSLHEVWNVGVHHPAQVWRCVPYVTAMMAYRAVHTGPNSQLGGAHVGFMSCEYQLYVFIGFELSLQQQISYSPPMDPPNTGTLWHAARHLLSAVRRTGTPWRHRKQVWVTSIATLKSFTTSNR